MLCVLVLLAFPLQRLAQTGQDLSGLIRSAIGDLAAARKQYDLEKGSYAFRLDVTGRDNKTLAAIDGEYPVIAGFQESGFLFDTPEGVKSLCRTSGCDWHPEHVVLVRGEAQQTTSLGFQIKTLRIEQLRDALSPYAGWETYLLGEARSPKPIDRPPLIITQGERVRFDHARLQDLEGLEGVMHDLALSVQVRHAPGVRVPSLVIEADQLAHTDVLSRWVEGLLAGFASP